MPTMTETEVELLVEIGHFGGVIFNPKLDGGRLRIDAKVYDGVNHPDVIHAFEKLQERGYLISESGIVFNLTDAGERKLREIDAG